MRSFAPLAREAAIAAPASPTKLRLLSSFVISTHPRSIVSLSGAGLISGSRLPSAAVLGNVDFGRLAPNSYLRRDPHRIGKFPCFQRIPELGRITVARIRHYDSVRQTPTADLVDHLQS